MRQDAFAGYHPVVNFFFLCGTISFGLIVQHPLWVAISFSSALVYGLMLGGRKAVSFTLTFVLPMVALTALLNPLFVHQGITILFYFRDNPVTLEAIVYGVTRGFMFGAGLLWFYCYQYVMTGDKFMHIFGKIMPSGSLIFSMVLNFVPRFSARLRIISDAQKCVGRDMTDGSLLEKIRHGVKVLSIMTTWSLENAIDTSDSMKSRGYGLQNRTSYVAYQPEDRDGILGVTLFVLAGCGAVATAKAMNLFVCYPMLTMAQIGSLEGTFAFLYGVFCFMPVFLNVTEALKWKHLQSET